MAVDNTATNVRTLLGTVRQEYTFLSVSNSGNSYYLQLQQYTYADQAFYMTVPSENSWGQSATVHYLPAALVNQFQQQPSLNGSDAITHIPASLQIATLLLLVAEAHTAGFSDVHLGDLQASASSDASSQTFYSLNVSVTYNNQTIEVITCTHYQSPEAACSTVFFSGDNRCHTASQRNELRVYYGKHQLPTRSSCKPAAPRHITNTLMMIKTSPAALRDFSKCRAPDFCVEDQDWLLSERIPSRSSHTFNLDVRR